MARRAIPMIAFRCMFILYKEGSCVILGAPVVGGFLRVGMWTDHKLSIELLSSYRRLQYRLLGSNDLAVQSTNSMFPDVDQKLLFVHEYPSLSLAVSNFYPRRQICYISRSILTLYQLI